MHRQATLLDDLHRIQGEEIAIQLVVRELPCCWAERFQETRERSLLVGLLRAPVETKESRETLREGEVRVGRV
jgi:hypothetical protein